MNSKEENQIQEIYKKILKLIFKNGKRTWIDKIDDYLLGFRKGIPNIELEEEEEQEKYNQIQIKLLELLINLPKKAVGALEEFIPGRTYSLLTLFCLLDDRCLIYALINLGISVLDFDWVNHFNSISNEVKLILESIRKTERNGKNLKIPRDIQRTLKEIQEKQNEIIENIDSEIIVEEEDIQKNGIWIGDYFVEDYDENLNNNSKYTNNSSIYTLTDQNTTTNQLQRKLNKLQNLKNQIVQQQQQTSLSAIPILHQPSPHSNPVDPNSHSINSSATNNHTTNSEQNHLNLPCYVQISNLPIDASLQSILFFLQNGPDIFKIARTQNQKIDALGRNLKKFQNNFWPSAGNQKKENQGNKKYSTIKETDIEFIKNQTLNNNNNNNKNRACQEFRTIIVKFHLNFDHSLVLDFINDFHNKKFFPSDLLSLPISCKLMS